MLKAEVIGLLGSDAVVKEIGGRQYVAFSVAAAEYQKNESGENVAPTTWVSVLWYGVNTVLREHLKKGVRVFVRGGLKVKLYEDKNGDTRYSVDINASEVQLCGKYGGNEIQ